MTATFRGSVAAQAFKAAGVTLLSASTDGNTVTWVYSGQPWMIGADLLSILGRDVTSTTMVGNTIVQQLAAPVYQGETVIGMEAYQFEITNLSTIPAPALTPIAALVYSVASSGEGAEPSLVSWWLRITFDGTPQTASNFAHGLVMSEDTSGAANVTFAVSTDSVAGQFVDGNDLHIKIGDEGSISDLTNRMILSVSYNQVGVTPAGTMRNGIRTVQPFAGFSVTNGITHHSPESLLWNRFGEWWDYRMLPNTVDNSNVTAWNGATRTIDLENSTYGSGSTTPGRFFNGIGVKVGSFGGSPAKYVPVADGHFDFTNGADKSFAVILMERVHFVSGTNAQSASFGLSELASAFGKVRAAYINPADAYRLQTPIGQILETVTTGDHFHVMNYRHGAGKYDIAKNGVLTEHTVTPLSAGQVINAVALYGPSGANDGSYSVTAHPAVPYMQAVRGGINQDEIDGVYSWTFRQKLSSIVGGSTVFGTVSAGGTQITLSLPVGHASEIRREDIVLSIGSGLSGETYLGVSSIYRNGISLTINSGAIYQGEPVSLGGIPGVTVVVTNLSTRLPASGADSTPNSNLIATPTGLYPGFTFTERIRLGNNDIECFKYVYGQIPRERWGIRTEQRYQRALESGEEFVWPEGWYPVSANVSFSTATNCCSLAITGPDRGTYMDFRAGPNAIIFKNNSYNPQMWLRVNNGARPPWEV